MGDRYDSLMPRDAVHMRLLPQALRRLEADLPGGVYVRGINPNDAQSLGQLLWAAFPGAADDEFRTASDAELEASETLAGKWGPAVWQASLAAQAGATMVAAVIVVRDEVHRDLPLLAYAVTDPGWQGRGIGRRLIEDSATRLAAAGLDELHLAVTPGSRAINLYLRLGFEIVTQD